MEAMDDEVSGRPDPTDLAAKLQARAAETLIKLKDESYSTHKVFNLVTNGVDDLFRILIDIIKAQFMSYGAEQVFSVQEVCSILDRLEGNSLFEGVHTPEELSKYVEQERCLIRPAGVEVTTQPVVAGKEVKAAVVEKGYIVPFLPMLEALLNCPEVLHCIDNPKPSVDGVFADPLDGYAYKKHPLVQKYPGTLGIRTYDDDAQCTDSASSQDVSVRFIYWTLLNIYPELRSSNRAIHLMGCMKTDLIKSTGHKVFLTDYVASMKQLCSEEGVTFTVMGKKRVFRAVMVDHNADNPAAASIGGFKESHFANCCCRQCYVTSEEMFSSFDEKDFVRRDKESHEKHVAEVEEYIEKKCKTKPSPSVTYGINSRSALMDIPTCDVTKCLPQDLMHDVILGTLKTEIICLLEHTLEKKKTSLKAINRRISSLVKYFGVNKPADIEASHIQNRSLRQSASETLALAYLLPFALQVQTEKGVELACDEANLHCYILRLNLLSLQMSDQFTMADLERLRKMTIDHHKRFQALYPGRETPKMHYETHFPMQIYLYGPLRLHWCFRFEGKHAYFKRLCRLMHNYVNIYEALAQRHQERQCGLMMLSAMGKNGVTYLSTNNSRGAPKKVILEVCIHKELLEQVFKDNSKTINEYTYVVHGGVHCSKETAIVTKFVKDVPICGEIVAIYGTAEKLAFVYTKLATQKYELSLNAFKVCHTEKVAVILAEDIAYRHHVVFIREVGANFVILPSKSYLSHKY